LKGEIKLSEDSGQFHKLMNENRENLERWFKEPLCSLYPNVHAGFPILMITLPLLERDHVFRVAPVRFSEKVIRTIESDFDTFQADEGGVHPVSQVSAGFSGYMVGW
jgi:hypothetical protein